MRRLARTVACGVTVAIAVVALPLSATSITNPAVSTDKADYAPGEIVTVSGTGLEASTTYDVPIIRPDDSIVKGDGASVDGWDSVTTDANGSFTYLYQLNSMRGLYEVRVYGSPWGGNTSEGPVASTTFTDGPPNLDHCQNGPLAGPVTCTGAAWANGNANAGNSHYTEGDSIPYRLTMTASAGAHNVIVNWDTTKGGKHALDYLTTVNRTETTANECSGVAGCVLATYDDEPIPIDPDAVNQIAGEFRLHGGTITSIEPYTLSGSYTGDSTRSVKINFTAVDTNQVLAWSAHIASRQDWGADNSAAAISGSPFHTSLGAHDMGGGGSQDRSLSAAAVIFPSSLKIIKDADPDSSQDFGFTTTGGLTPSTFSLDDDSDATLSNTQEYSGLLNIEATTYTVTETLVGGWTLADFSCVVTSPNGGSHSLTDNVATIDLGEGENATCTFKNTREQGSIEVQKVWEGTKGTTTLQIGTAASGDDVDDVASVELVEVDGTTGATPVGSGTYYVSETDPGSDYTSELACVKNGDSYTPGTDGSVEVGKDDVVVCTFTNTRNQGSIELEKVWDGTEGSTTLQIGTTDGDTDVATATVTGADGTTGPKSVDTGTYYVSEAGGLDDYTPSLACVKNGDEYTPGSNNAVEVGKDDVVVCTFTNTRDQGSVELEKVWEGTKGTTTLQIGSAATGDDADDVASVELVEVNGTTGAKPVDTGTYYVSETDPGPDYTTGPLECSKNGDAYTPGSDGSVEVGKDDVVVCTFTNTRNQGSIELDKVWDGTEGSTTLQIGTAEDGTDVATATVTGEDGTTGAKTVDTGTYYVSETDPGPDYTAGPLECSRNGDGFTPGADGSVEVGKDDVVVCTFTNTRNQGTIELEKVWAGTKGTTTLQIGTAASGDDVDDVASVELVEVDGTTGAKPVDTGTYYVSETDPGTTYVTTLVCIDGQGAVVVDNGSVEVGKNQNVVCTFTNTRKRASIELQKVWVGEAGSTTLQIGTSGGATDVATATVTNADGTTGATGVDTGTYYVSEAGGLEDYSSELECFNNAGQEPAEVTVGDDNSVDLEQGDVVVCTFTNTELGDVQVIKTDVDDPASGQFTFTLTGGPDDVEITQTTNDGESTDSSLEFTDLKPGTYELCEVDVPEWYDSSLGPNDNGDCFEFELEPGEPKVIEVHNNPCPAGTLTVVKTIPDVIQEGDTYEPIFDVTGPDGFTAEITIPFAPGDTENSGSTEVPTAGTYLVVERGTEATQEVEILIPDCAATAGFGNTFLPPAVEIQKVTIPAGNEANWEFTLRKGGVPIPAGPVLTDPNGDASFQNLDEGNYVVSETPQPGFTQVSAQGCTFTVNLPQDAGAVYTCTVVNEEDTGGAIIKREKFPGQRARRAKGHWTFYLRGGPNNVSLHATTNRGRARSQIAFNHLRAGDYTLCEKGYRGWKSNLGGKQGFRLSNGDRCVRITLQAGRPAVFNVTNTCSGKP